MAVCCLAVLWYITAVECSNFQDHFFGLGCVIRWDSVHDLSVFFPWLFKGAFLVPYAEVGLLCCIFEPLRFIVFLIFRRIPYSPFCTFPLRLSKKLAAACALRGN